MNEARVIETPAALREAMESLWMRSFGDERRLTGAILDFAEGQGALRTVVADGRLASMCLAIPMQVALEDGGLLDVQYLYGLCTDAALRRRGHGRRLVWEICREAADHGCAAVVLQPATGDLARYYARLGFEEDASFRDHADSALPHAAAAEMGDAALASGVRLGADEYGSRREAALRGVRHVVYSREFLELAGWVYEDSGGGFLDLGGAVAAVEIMDGAPVVREWLPRDGGVLGAPPPAPPMARWLNSAGGGIGWMPFNLD